MDGLSDAELEGVAVDIQTKGKLKDLADALEVVPLLESLEGAKVVNVPFTLLHCWHLTMKDDLEAHSLLIHHLRCINLQETADK